MSKYERKYGFHKMHVETEPKKKHCDEMKANVTWIGLFFLHYSSAWFCFASLFFALSCFASFCLALLHFRVVHWKCIRRKQIINAAFRRSTLKINLLGKNAVHISFVFSRYSCGKHDCKIILHKVRGRTNKYFLSLCSSNNTRLKHIFRSVGFIHFENI